MLTLLKQARADGAWRRRSFLVLGRARRLAREVNQVPRGTCKYPRTGGAARVTLGACGGNKETVLARLTARLIALEADGLFRGILSWL